MRRHPLLATYFILLVLSTVLRGCFFAFAERLPPGPEFTGTAGSPVIILAAAGDDSVPNALLAPPLSDHHRLALVPDGVDPGPVLERFDRTPVHLVAFGTAGPLAISLAAGSPTPIRSLTLIDADGIEEFDLLGDHNLNQLLRRAQVVSTVAAEWLLPHFFAIDYATGESEARAKRLLTYDRRTIRDELARWNGPTAIYVSESSGATVATAREHARLLPQSTLGGWRIDSLPAFLDQVEAGNARTRANASPERIAAATAPFDAGGLSSAQGSSLLVVLVLLALATLLSEDLACVTAGMLAARGSIPLLPGIVACYIGIIAGDQLLYLLGRSAGRALVTHIPIKWILPADRLDRAVEWFRTHGMRVVLTSRLLPGTRSTVYVAAGILRAGFVRFALWLVVIGAIWTPALVGLSYVATLRGRSLIEALPGPTWPWALGAMIGGTLLVRWILSAATPEGRAGFHARWQKAKGAK